MKKILRAKIIVKMQKINQREYTLIAEYKGGTYISQYTGKTLTEVLDKWGENLPREIYSAQIQRKIQDEIKNPNLFPVAIRDMKNVWCTTYLSGDNFLLLNIIKTAIY